MTFAGPVGDKLDIKLVLFECVVISGCCAS